MSLSVIIPHRGNALGLWATVTSCRIDLDESGLKDFDFIIVSNGEKLLPDAKNVVRFLSDEGLLAHHYHTDDPLTPQAAREIGAGLSDRDLLFFLDNHCVVKPGYFRRAVDAMDAYAIRMLHSTTIYYPGFPPDYHYNLTLKRNFWGHGAKSPEGRGIVPYKCAAGGHGGFVIARDLFSEVGGYGPAELFSGYAGEELTFDLKLWRLGHSVWLDPKLVHYHFAGDRGYSRHYTDDFYRNLMVSAKVIGGQRWLDELFLNLVKGPTSRYNSVRHWFDIYQDADTRAAQYAVELDTKSKYSLDELLIMFRQQDVAH